LRFQGNRDDDLGEVDSATSTLLDIVTDAISKSFGEIDDVYDLRVVEVGE
jgi:hypothetical protein